MTVSVQNSEYDLSVIITCRDSMESLPQCIGTVQPLMLQSRLRVQVLVVDMGSADGTLPYLAAERDRWHISAYVSESFENRFAAMNRGLELAQGRVCLFITPETELMVENTTACCTPILAGDAESVFSTAVQVNPANGQYRPQTPNTKQLFLRTPCHVAAFFCSTRLLRQLGGFDWMRYPALADVELMHRVLACGASHQVAALSTCRLYGIAFSEEEQLHVDFLRFIATRRDDILLQCKAHPSYAVRAVHEMLRHAVRCDWPVAGGVTQILDALLRELGRVLRPIIRRKIIRRLRRRAVIQAALLPFKGLRRARITSKLCRSHFHVARLLGETETKI